MRHATKTLVLTLLASAALAACQPAQQAAQDNAAPPSPAALPLDTNSAAPLADAPAATALPAAPPAPVASTFGASTSYAPADQAWAMSDGFADSAPDYAIDSGGVTPWVWTADDNSVRVAEAVPGGERYYYYQPGSDQPFYVQDPDYGYAFQGGVLLSVYDHSGHSVAVAGHADVAGRYLARGETLKRAVASAPHQPVAANNWAARRGVIASQHTAFSNAAAANPGLNAFHSQHAAQEQAKWAPEAAKRESWAAATDARLGNQADADRERSLAQAGHAPLTAAPPEHAPPPTTEAQPEHTGQPPAAETRPGPEPRPEAAPGHAAPEAAHPPQPTAEHRPPEHTATPAHPAKAPEPAAHQGKPPETHPGPDDRHP